MKRLFSYKTWRNILCATGIPFFSMLISCYCKYGMPDDWHNIQGSIADFDSEEPISEVKVTNAQGDYTFSDSNGFFDLGYIDDDGCANFTFEKDGYRSIDTTLCEGLVEIKMKENH